VRSKGISIQPHIDTPRRNAVQLRTIAVVGWITSRSALAAAARILCGNAIGVACVQ